MLISNLASDLARGDYGEHTYTAAIVELAKARVLNNLERNLPEQPREAESIA